MNSAKQREVATNAMHRLLSALEGPLPSCSPESLALIVSHVAANAVEIPLHRVGLLDLRFGGAVGVADRRETSAAHVRESHEWMVVRS